MSFDKLIRLLDALFVLQVFLISFLVTNLVLHLAS